MTEEAGTNVNKYNDPTLPGYNPGRASSYGAATNGSQLPVSSSYSSAPNVGKEIAPPIPKYNSPTSHPNKRAAIPQQLLGTWSRSNNTFPRWKKLYTFSSDGRYEYNLLAETSPDLNPEQIIGTVTANGSNLILHPESHVKVVNGKQQLGNLTDERWSWQLDNSLAYGGVIMLKINRGSGEETFYRNA